MLRDVLNTPLKNALRNPLSFYGQRANLLARFMANGFYPELAMDAANDEYFVQGRKSSFDEMFPSYSGPSLRTMVDSDGVLKWAPHNLFSYSEELTRDLGLYWRRRNGIVVTEVVGDGPPASPELSFLVAPGASTGAYFEQNVGGNSREVYEVKAAGHRYLHLLPSGRPDYAIVDLQNGTVTRQTGAYFNVVSTPLGDGWHSIQIDKVGGVASSERVGLTSSASEVADNVSIPAGDGVTGFLAARPRSYRADLGGMVNNPDRGDSYVPTTSSAVYLPRRNNHVWNGSAWVNAGLLYETEARTNLLLQSEDMIAGAWNASRATISSNGDGSFTITQDAEDFDGQITQSNITVGAGETWTMTAEVKQGSWPSFRFRERLTTGGSVDSWFNASTGLWANLNAAHTGYVEELEDGWYRASITFTINATGRTSNIEFGPDSGSHNVQASAGDIGNTVLIRWPQLEQGATPSSYIPTAGAAATRAAESGLTIPSALMPWNASGVSIAVAGRMTYADTNTGAEKIVYGWTGSTPPNFPSDPNYIITFLGTNSTESGEFNFRKRTDGVVGQVTSSTTALSPGVNVPFSISQRVSGTDINAAFNGSAFSAAAIAGIPDMSSTDFILGYDFMGNIGKLLVWADDIEDAGIEEASA